jgi:hypothetical protein
MSFAACTRALAHLQLGIGIAHNARRNVVVVVIASSAAESRAVTVLFVFFVVNLLVSWHVVVVVACVTRGRYERSEWCALNTHRLSTLPAAARRAGAATTAGARAGTVANAPTNMIG